MTPGISTIYVDAQEEITSVIERLKGAHDPIVALVVPKGAALTQSLVNLKLARKAAADAAKDLILVTTDAIGQNLAVQVGIPVAKTEKEVGHVASGQVSASAADATVISGVRIHQYQPDDSAIEDLTSTDSEHNPEVIEPENIGAAAAPLSESVLVPKELFSTPSPKTSSTPLPQEGSSTTPEPSPTPEPETPEPVPENMSDAETSRISHAEVVLTSQSMTPQSEMKRRIIARDTSSGVESASKPSQRRTLLWVLALVLILLIGGGSSLAAMPATTVVLTVAGQPWEESLDLPATTATIPAESTDAIAAESISVEDSLTLNIPATGTKKVGEAATGTATLYNYDSTSSQSLPAGSKIIAGGRTFTTQSAVSVPGFTQSVGGPRNPGSQSVAIAADEVGSESNLTDATGSISGSGINLSAKLTAAGGSSRDVVILSQSDIANAKTAATKQLQEKLAVKIADSIKDRDLVFALDRDVLKIGDFTTNQAAGTEISSAEAKVSGTLQRFVVDKHAITKAVEARALKATLPGEQRAVTSVDSRVASVNDSGLVLSVQSKGVTTPVFTTDTLPSKISGHSAAQAVSYLTENTPATAVTITRRPTWWPIKRLPFLKSRIAVQITYE